MPTNGRQAFTISPEEETQMADFGLRLRGKHVEVRRIPPEVMEMISDIYLACAERDPEFPAYAESYLQGKLQRAASPTGWGQGTAGVSGEMLDAEVAAMLHGAGLTAQQAAAWQLHLTGMRPAEIAILMGTSHPTAARLIKGAGRRVQEFHAKYGGLHTIYRSEIRRPIYRKPGHCGAMHCRRLGYCRFALSMEEGE
jgi:hypothetical protein